MSRARNSQRQRRNGLYLVSLGGVALLLALFALCGFRLLASPMAYALILLCPLVYLGLMWWGAKHYDKPMAGHREPASTTDRKRGEKLSDGS